MLTSASSTRHLVVAEQLRQRILVLKVNTGLEPRPATGREDDSGLGTLLFRALDEQGSERIVDDRTKWLAASYRSCPGLGQKLVLNIHCGAHATHHSIMQPHPDAPSADKASQVSPVAALTGSSPTASPESVPSRHRLFPRYPQPSSKGDQRPPTLPAQLLLPGSKWGPAEALIPMRRAVDPWSHRGWRTGAPAGR